MGQGKLPKLDLPLLKFKDQLSTKAKAALEDFVLKGDYRKMTDDVAFELIDYAHSKEVFSFPLEKYCLDWLSRTMSVDNVFSRLEKAEEAKNYEISGVARQFIDVICHPMSEYPLSDEVKEKAAAVLNRVDPVFKGYLTTGELTIKGTAKKREDGSLSYSFPNIERQLPATLAAPIAKHIEEIAPRLAYSTMFHFENYSQAEKAAIGEEIPCEIRMKVGDAEKNATSLTLGDSFQATEEVRIVSKEDEMTPSINVHQLSSMSTYFAKNLAQTGVPTIASANPLLTTFIMNALSNNTRVFFPNLSYQDRLQVLKEAEKMHVYDLVVNERIGAFADQDLDSFFIDLGPKGMVSPVTLEVLKFAKEHGKTFLGYMTLLACYWTFFENGELRESIKNNPEELQLVRQIWNDPNLNYFKKLAAKDENRWRIVAHYGEDMNYI